MYVPVPVFALFVILEAAALLIAVYLTFPGLFARLKPAKAKAPAPEQWMLLEAPDGQIIAWRIGDDLAGGYIVSDPGPFTRAQIERMAQN